MFLVPRMFVGTSFRELKPNVGAAVTKFLAGAALHDVCGPLVDIASTEFLVSLTLRPKTRNAEPVVYGSAFPDVAGEIRSASGNLHAPDTFERWTFESMREPWSRWFHLHTISHSLQRSPGLAPALLEVLASNVEVDSEALGRRLCIAVVDGCEPEPMVLHEYGLLRHVGESLSFRQRSWGSPAEAAINFRDVAEKVRFRLENGPPFPGR